MQTSIHNFFINFAVWSIRFHNFIQVKSCLWCQIWTICEFLYLLALNFFVVLLFQSWFFLLCFRFSFSHMWLIWSKVCHSSIFQKLLSFSSVFTKLLMNFKLKILIKKQISIFCHGQSPICLFCVCFFFMNLFLNNFSLINERSDFIKDIILDFILLDILFFLSQNLTNSFITFVVFRCQ